MAYMCHKFFYHLGLGKIAELLLVTSPAAPCGILGTSWLHLSILVTPTHGANVGLAI